MRARRDYLVASPSTMKECRSMPRTRSIDQQASIIGVSREFCNQRHNVY
jgi:hypothetical protein